MEFAYLAFTIFIALQSPPESSDDKLQCYLQNSQVLFRFFSCLNTSSESGSSLSGPVDGVLLRAGLLANCLIGALGGRLWYPGFGCSVRELRFTIGDFPPIWFFV
jgi:hypothetical protein